MIRYLVARRVNIALNVVVETKCQFKPIRTGSSQSTMAKGEDTFSKVRAKDTEAQENVEERRIAVSPKEQRQLAKRKPTSSLNSRLLKVAIVGTPNAGKSTLANQLIGWKFAPVSQKVHTTRHKTLGVLTEDNKQVIFLDTPGLIVPSKMKRHNLEKTLLIDPHLAVVDADLLAIVVDVSHVWNRTKLDTEILKILHVHPDKKSILILNKVDLVRDKRELLGIARTLTEGVVAGTKSWTTPKRLRQPDLEVLFSNMKLQNKDNLTADVAVAVDETNDNGNKQFCETDGTTITVGETAEVLSDSDVSEDERREEMDLKQDSRSSVNFDLRNPKVWELYYKQIEHIGLNLVDKCGWEHFDRVFMISALSGDGIFDLKTFTKQRKRKAEELKPQFLWMTVPTRAAEIAKEHLLNETYNSPLHYHPSLVTDQNPMALARLCVFERLLDHLPDEIPYQIKVKLSLWEVTEDNLLRISFDIICSKKRHLRCVFGKEGKTIRTIAAEAKQQLMNAFRRELSLQLRVHGTGDFFKNTE